MPLTVKLSRCAARYFSLTTNILFLMGLGQVYTAPLTTVHQDHHPGQNITTRGDYTSHTGSPQFPNYYNTTIHEESPPTGLGPKAIFNSALPTSPLSPSANAPSALATALPPAVTGDYTTSIIKPTNLGTSEPPTKTTTNNEINKTSSEPVRKIFKKVTISPSFFYMNGRARVKCASPKVAYHITPYVNPAGFPLEKWPEWKELYPHEPDGWVEIESYQLACSGACNCNEDGKIVPRTNTNSCGSQRQADRCSVVFACYCTAVLVQPIANMAAFPGATRDDFQDAINRIPETIRNDNPHYWWQMHGLAVPRRPWDFMGWARGPAVRPTDQPPPWLDSGPFRPSAYELDPPLEGPDDLPPYSYYGGLRYGDRASYGKPWKREIAIDSGPASKLISPTDSTQGFHRGTDGEEIDLNQPSSVGQQ
ncbi:hypothetical protein TWF481_004971 [Arthrobotrys musiformis]|uniref:Uncharacterized protein n=1 Tax=Arthrobotrys musiformis TaxID=47236 RepID=A0AAV9WM94_9PEZI